MLTLTDENFDQTIQNAQKPILVDFWATWCGPCQITGPILEQVEKDMNGKIEIGKLEVDENPITAGKFQIQSIPTMVVFKNGKPIEGYIGVRPKDFLIERLNKILEKND